jgi:hypothetical protein
MQDRSSAGFIVETGEFFSSRPEHRFPRMGHLSFNDDCPRDSGELDH